MVRFEITGLAVYAAAAAKLLQSCPTLCNSIDGGPPGSPVPGILQARTLELVAISFSNTLKGKVKVKSLSHVRLFPTPWSAAYQAPPSMGFSRQEYWSGVPSPSPILGIYPYKTVIRKDTCIPIFIAALFTIVKKWKQSKYPSAYEWIKKMWYIYTMEYYSIIKKNERMPFTATWMDLENIILSEVSQTEKEKYHIIPLMCGI